ncbi:hypothetical protein EVAR_58529_1 [Eumeta japonica]|uniref:DUF4371 domain-containing protein n=1 Tax=Eumeta variegata TaxID=151549 RepID=A0A4C1Z5P0_EUMVA|nr:hypothetical protein EVAR_58529_1 [Eumeta japonica]
MDTEILVLSSSNQEEQVLDSPIRSDDASAIDQQVLDNLDPGFWKFPITDSQRRDIVQSGPTQQLNDDEYYPKAVTKTTGEYLANAILEHLEKYDLNIQDCRGQGYDNGANMVATEQGLAKYVLPTSNLGLAPPLTLGIEILGNQPYSLDLTPCHFYLFSKTKEKLRGKCFTAVAA